MLSNNCNETNFTTDSTSHQSYCYNTRILLYSILYSMFHVCKDDMLIGFTDFGCLGVRLAQSTLRRNCSNRNDELHKNLKLYKKMGGGSSVLSPELSKSLTQPSINEFHRFQLECESKHMTPVEMYLFLSLLKSFRADAVTNF